MKDFKYFRDQVGKSLGVKNWKELDFVFSGRVPMMYWNKAVKKYVEYVTKQNSAIFSFSDGTKITMQLFQSPRGLRHGTLRPDTVHLRVNDNFTKAQLDRLIQQLILISQVF